MISARLSYGATPTSEVWYKESPKLQTTTPINTVNSFCHSMEGIPRVTSHIPKKKVTMYPRSSAFTAVPRPISCRPMVISAMKITRFTRIRKNAY